VANWVLAIRLVTASDWVGSYKPKKERKKETIQKTSTSDTGPKEVEDMFRGY